MNLIITGPQASGKGTQSALLVKKLGLFHLSTGAALREIAKKNTPLGRKVKNYLELGQLVPDRILNEVVGSFLTRQNLERGIIFDGTPRIKTQLVLLEEMLKKKGSLIDRVLYIFLSKGEVLRRLSARVICSKCGENYNLLTKKPGKENTCDSCGGRLRRRKDESPAAIKKRLAIYKKDTEPILEVYRKRGILEEIDGERPIEVIFKDIMTRLKGAG